MKGYIRKVITEIKEDWKRFMVEQLLDLFLVASVVLYLQKYVSFHVLLGMIVIYIFYHSYKHIKKLYNEIRGGEKYKDNGRNRK